MHPTPTRRSALQFGLQAGSAAAAVAAFPTLLGSAHAQSPWPSKPIRLLVPFAPGGSSEIVARSAASEISKSLGQNVFVENKPGASGNIAMQECAASTDGHTMILGHIGTLAVNPFIFDKLPFDTNRDFRPISLLAKVPSLYVVNSEVPAKNLKEFITLARAKPGQLNYGSAGNGSAGHLAFEYLKMAADIFVLHVPYRGTGPQLTDLLAGRLEAASVGAPAILPHIKSGKLRCIATGTKERLPQLPDVPTVAESGYPGFEMTQWYGLNAPASMPQAAIDRIADACAKAMRNPLATERLRGDTAQPVGDTPAQYAAFIKTEQARWKQVAARAKIKPD
ncbi:MAG: ABC transporter substrate-binding protein [Polaromonas sp.]|nr:ABC transporter substrate-binding protein [Polaromonas sp.]